MRKSILIAVIAALMAAAPSHAGVKTVGRGDTLNFDPSGFPPAMRTNFDILRIKCVKCHTMERTVVAITTGIAPITSQPFDRNATKMYGIKMMRKPDSNMNKQEVKATVDLMNYLLDQAAR
ncbi:cytochrome C [Geobacter sp. DSM 9736]|uniref:cytochrome C n=1 Tax=Geobacter sp. DSM 9736 TaxID=1277350 RepID=UPI000B507758|nr:cytochrome C [Geobacter sp. DSM 9736]SNB44655.1 hypothetical protein SAMN06269301_0042 [Geobacter sp. DSM 9736]